jgi:hypothetical protein
MKIRTRWLLSLGVVGIALVGLGVFARTTAAFAPFSLHSLNGAYVGNVVEIRQDVVPGPVQYCDEYLTLTFDGSGSGTIDNVRRCTEENGAPDVVHDVDTLTYTVSSSGLTTLTFGSGEGGVAQLADNGKVGIISTGILPLSEDANIFVRHGSIVKQ